MTGAVRRAMRSEWTKLRSVQSTPWGMIAVVGVTVGVTAFFTAVGSTDANEVGGRGDDDVVVNALQGVLLGQVAMVAFGVIAIASEFTTGTIRSTFSAIPRRGLAFGAKAAAVSVVALAVGGVASMASFLVAQPLLHEGGYVPPAYPYVSLADPFVLRAVSGTALYLALLALFALGFAGIVRHTAVAMVTAVGLVLAPIVLMGFFTGSVRELLQWATPVAGLSIQITRERLDNPPYGPWFGLGITAAWALAALLGGLWMQRRRDV